MAPLAKKLPMRVLAEICFVFVCIFGGDWRGGVRFQSAIFKKSGSILGTISALSDIFILKRLYQIDLLKKEGN